MSGGQRSTPIGYYECSCGSYCDHTGRTLKRPGPGTLILDLAKNGCEACQPSDVPCFRCRCGTYLNKYKKVTYEQDGDF